MDLLRRTSIAAGTLFVVATAASLTGNALLPPVSGTDRLARLAEHPDRAATAVLLSLVAAACSAAIAVALYPVLRTVDPALALGSVVFRALEAVFYSVGAVFLLTLLSTAEDLGTVAAVPAQVRTAADVLVAGHRQAAAVGVLAFVVGASLYYLVLYRSRLVPRWLSVWGLAALVVMGVAADYVRVHTRKECRLTLASLVKHLGRPYQLSLLEIDMPSFKGRLRTRVDEYVWHYDR